MGEITERRYEGLTVWIGPEHVVRSRGCAYTTACDLMRECLGRQPGERGLLRVPLPVWERFLMRKARLTVSTRTKVDPPPGLISPTRRGSSARTPDGSTSRRNEKASSPEEIRETQPRIKKR
jgi:hypothetical protein